MPRRTRTAKKLAQRIDLAYFKRSHPLRRWRFVLSLAAPLAACAWLAWEAASGDARVFSSGPISSTHAAFATRCPLCHAGGNGSFARGVTDAACRACHDGAAHHPAPSAAPACAGCHVEHRGAARLDRPADGTCTPCHADLATRDGAATRFASSIHAFASDHPEFAALRKPAGGTRSIKFSHAGHLRAGLSSPGGTVQLACADCHPAPRDADTAVLAAEGGEPRGIARGALQYEQHCARCHVLQFDELFDEPAPHERPDVVRAFVGEKIAGYAAAHPGSFVLAERVARAERLLWRKTCRECHTLDEAKPGAPEVAAPELPGPRLPHARFGHRAHRFLRCDSCHAAGSSARAEEVLVPGIDTCRRCHHGGAAAAESSCAGCHLYHDRGLEGPPLAPYSVEEVAGLPRAAPGRY